MILPGSHDIHSISLKHSCSTYIDFLSPSGVILWLKYYAIQISVSLR